jgi:hypothetical protein
VQLVHRAILGIELRELVSDLQRLLVVLRRDRSLAAKDRLDLGRQRLELVAIVEDLVTDLEPQLGLLAILRRVVECLTNLVARARPELAVGLLVDRGLLAGGQPLHRGFACPSAL